MARGDYFKNPDNVKKKQEAMKAKNDELNRFFIKINENLAVERDNFNVILSKKAESGAFYSLANFSKFHNVVDYVLENKLAQPEEVESYMMRIKEITSSYKDGDLIVNFPENFKFDERK